MCFVILKFNSYLKSSVKKYSTYLSAKLIMGKHEEEKRKSYIKRRKKQKARIKRNAKRHKMESKDGHSENNSLENDNSLPDSESTLSAKRLKETVPNKGQTECASYGFETDPLYTSMLHYNRKKT